MTITTLLLVGLGVILIIVLSLYILRRAEEDPLSTRIEEFAAREELVSIEDIELSLSFSDRVIVPIMRRIGEAITRFAPQTTMERTAKRLELAGSPRNMSAAEFWAICGFAAILLGGLFWLLMVRFGAAPSRQILYALIMAILGFILPHMFLSSLITRRKQAIIKKLPDALDLMTICVDAGLTFDGAMAKVNEKWDDPLAQDLGRVIYEMQLGKSKRQALKDMSERMDVPDVTSFVASILQAEQLGVSIGKVLRIQAEQMRVKRRQRAEEKAQQAPVKMLFPMVFLIFPSLFVVLLGPAALRVIRSNALRGITG